MGHFFTTVASFYYRSEVRARTNNGIAYRVSTGNIADIDSSFKCGTRGAVLNNYISQGNPPGIIRSLDSRLQHVA